jgi:hypothetical protein
MKKDYAGWNLEAIESGIVHKPMDDMDTHFAGNTSDSANGEPQVSMFW